MQNDARLITLALHRELDRGRDAVDVGEVSAVARQQNDVAEAVVGERLQQSSIIALNVSGETVKEPAKAMVVGKAGPDDRRDQGLADLERDAAGHLGADQRIGEQRHVRAVLLDRCALQDDRVKAVREGGLDLRPRHFFEQNRSRHGGIIPQGDLRRARSHARRTETGV
ncbi:MAG: hypothetical protein R2724_13705 [Bryobacterales bacterium]